MKLPLTPQRTRPSFGFANIERSLADCMGQRRFGKPEQLAVIAFFDDDLPRCVFCGSDHVERWDHLVAVMQGGETVLGNMVLACRTCDDSKQHFPYDLWMRSHAPQSPTTRGISAGEIEQRIVRIVAYVVHYGYMVRPLEERLDAEGNALLLEARKHLAIARTQVEALITRYETLPNFITPDVFQEESGIHPAVAASSLPEEVG